jgi:simple sugar transport system permease protein
VIRAVLSAAAGLGCVGALVAALGYPPLPALRALLAGALGGPPAWTATLIETGPLLLSGLAVALCFRAGVWNIGAEGQLLAGALAATALATQSPADAPAWLLAPAVSLAGAAGGALFGAAAGLLRATRGVSEVISTILLNFVAIQCVALAVQGPLQEASGAYPQSDAFPPGALLPAFGRVHAGLAAGLFLAAALHWMVFNAAIGFRMRAVGLSPRAARFAGIRPERIAVGTLALAGALAGLAGAFQVAGVTGRLYEGLSPGYGYTAIAVALLARLEPIAVVASALFFGALEAGAAAMQREAGVPAQATKVVQGVVLLLSVGLTLARRPRRSLAAEEPG